VSRRTLPALAGATAVVWLALAWAVASPYLVVARLRAALDAGDAAPVLAALDLDAIRVHALAGPPVRRPLALERVLAPGALAHRIATGAGRAWHCGRGRYAGSGAFVLDCMGTDPPRGALRVTFERRLTGWRVTSVLAPPRARSTARPRRADTR